LLIFPFTAPNAQTEMVLVCVVCHKLLTEEEQPAEGTKEKAS